MNLTIKNKNIKAVFSPLAGSSLRSLIVSTNDASYDVISNFDDDFSPNQLPLGSGSFIMAPWVNRIKSGLLKTEKGLTKLPNDVFFNDRLNAIHGIVWDKEWNIDFHEENRIQCSIDLREPWPFKGKIVMKAFIQDNSLIQQLSGHNYDDVPMPIGVGWHPWFRRILNKEQAVLKINAKSMWDLDDKGIPTGALIENNEILEKLREGLTPQIDELNKCCLKVNPEEQILYKWPELELLIESSEDLGHIMLYSPENSVCVEPQTTTVNAFQLENDGLNGTGVKYLKKGESFSVSTKWSIDY